MRPSKQNELLDGHERQVGIIFLDLFQRRTKLGILNDGIRENTGTAHNGTARHLAGYAFNQLATGPIDISIEVCHLV